MDEEFENAELVGFADTGAPEDDFSEGVEFVGWADNQPEPEAPAYPDDTWGKQARRLAAGAFAIPLQGMSSINSGVGGILQAGGELTGFDTLTDAGDSLKATSRLLNAQLRDNTGIQPGTWEDTALSIGGEVAAGLATMGGGIATGASKVASAAAPLVYQLGQRYTDLRDRGAEPGEAALGTAVSAPLNTALNLVDVGAINKTPAARNLAMEYLKRAGLISSVNAATNVAGVYGDALIDKHAANTPLTPEEFMTRVKTGAIAGAASGPLFAGVGMANRPSGPDAADMLDQVLSRQGGVVDGELPVGIITDSEIPVLPRPEPVPDPSSSLQAIEPEGSPIVLTDEFGNGPRTPNEQQQLAERYQPYLEQIKSPIVPPPELQVAPPPLEVPQVYKPVTAKGTLRADLTPDQRRVVEYVRGSADYNSQKAKAEEAAGIYAEDLARRERDRTSSPRADNELVLKLEPATKEFPDSPLIKAEASAKQPENIIELQPKPGETIELPYEPSSLIETDITNRGFARALYERELKKAVVTNPDGTKSLSSEAGAFNPMLMVEDAANFFRNALRSSDDVITNKVEPGDAYKRYNSLWGRSIEWMGTTARNVPESREAIQAGWEMPHDISALMYDHNQALKGYMALPDKARVNNALIATRVASAQAKAKGQKLVADATHYQKLGLTPPEVQAALDIGKWSSFSNELNRKEALEALNYKAQKRGTPVSKQELDNVNSFFNQLAESNYVPFSRFGKFFADMEAPDGAREYRQFETKREMLQFVRDAKKSGWKENSAGELRLNNFTKHDGVSGDILAMLEDGDSPVPVQGWRGHLLNARLVRGQSIDLERALADYAVGQAKTLATRRFERKFEQAMGKMATNPDLKPVADKVNAWKETLLNKDSEFIKGLNEAFNWSYIGGNLRTPLADVLGRVQLQYPMIARYTSGLGAEKVFAKSALKEAQWYFGKLGDEALNEGITQATRRGVIPPIKREGVVIRNQNSKLMNTAKGNSKSLATAHDLYFSLKALSDRSTDLGGFIAGWEVYPSAVGKLKAKGLPVPDRQTFAENFVRESKAVPSKGELPAGYNQSTTRLIFKYRLFQGKILKSYLEAFKDREAGQVVRQMMASLGTTGIKGIPFVSTLLVAAKSAGYEPETEARRNLPKGVADALLYGPFSEATGLALHNAASFGEIAPGIGTSAKEAVYKTLLGVAGAPAEGIDKALNYADRDMDLKALASVPFMPQTASNLLNVVDRSIRGVQTIDGTGVVPPEELTFWDQFWKLGGVTTTKLAKAYAANNVIAQGKRRDNEFYNQRIADARFTGDRQRELELRREAREDGVKVDMGRVADKVKAMRGNLNAKLKGMSPEKKRQVKQDLKLYED